MGLKVKLTKNNNLVEIKKDGETIGIIKVDPLSVFTVAKLEIEFNKEYEIRRFKEVNKNANTK